MPKKPLSRNYRITEREALILKLYAEQEGMKNSAVIRELIRALEPKLRTHARKELERDFPP
jgi:hypothetical protein